MINILDIETFEKKGAVVPYCVCVLLNEKVYNHYNEQNIIIKCLNTIVNNCDSRTCEIYVHNLNFDGILIIEELSINYIKYALVSDKTNLYSIKISYCGVDIFLKCSYKIIPESLSNLGKLEKMQKTPFPYKFVNENNLNYVGDVPDKKYWEKNDYTLYLSLNDNKTYDLKKETISYCTNDLFLTKKILSNLFRVIDLEDRTVRKKSLSAASMSHKIFYKKYNTFSIEEKIKVEDDAYIRNSYFGGRCEVFGNLRENEHIKYYDFSGMYGQCMLENFHYGKGCYEKANDLKKPGFYNIRYFSDFDFLPVLPSHFNNKLVFYNGTMEGTFWFEEIKLFEEMGGKILKINNAFVYEKYDHVFENYVNKFNEIRIKGGYFKIWAKLMINSLYGSMGLKTKEIFQYITFSYDEFCNINEKTNVESFYKISTCYIILIKIDYKFKKIFKENIEDSVHFSVRNVSYASAIASKARIKLYRMMLEVLKDGGRLLYCDTDSIFAAYPKTDTRFGFKNRKWLEFYDDGIFIAPKTYGLRYKKEDIIKIKGISHKELSLLEAKNKFYSGAEIIFDNQLTFKKNNFTLEQLYKNKKISFNNYDKRNFIENKTNTEPFSYIS